MPVIGAQGLRRGRLRFLVPHLAVNDRREAVLRVPLDVLPDVQNRSAGRVDHHAANPAEALHVGRRDAERRQDDDILGVERGAIGIGIAEELNPLGAQAIVDVRVVDDFAGQEDAAVGKPLTRLVRVVDGAIDAVAESELAREMNGEAARLMLEVVRLDLLDELAVIVLVQLGRDRVFQVEPFSKRRAIRGHYRG